MHSTWKYVEHQLQQIFKSLISGVCDSQTEVLESRENLTFVYDYTVLTKVTVCGVLVWIMNTKWLTVKVNNYPVSNDLIVLGVTQCTSLVTETYIQIG